MKLTIELTDAQYAGLMFVANKNSESGETPEQYAQRVLSVVFDSYAKEVTAYQQTKLVERFNSMSKEDKEAMISSM